MTINFSRAISNRSGVQLNFISDQSEIGSVASDYNGAFIGRFARGRIDKVFAVTREKMRRQLGDPVSLTVSALAEAQVHIYEALLLGAQQAIVARLVGPDAVNNLLVATAAVPDQAGVTPAVWSTIGEADALPAGALLSLRHLECFNDGVIAQIHADAAQDADHVAIASKVVTIQLVDPQTDKVILGPFVGSLDPSATDEYGNSFYIVDVVSSSTELLEVVEVADGASVPVNCPFYGKENGLDKFSSKLLSYFTEGGTTYSTVELEDAIQRLKRSRPNFTYIGCGGTENIAMLSLLLALGKEINKQVLWDIPGRLAPEAAVAFYASVGGSANALYSQCYWTPLKRENPLASGKGYIGTSGQQIGLRCARNAQLNAKGIAPRHRPIAGSDFSLTGTKVTQAYDVLNDELEQLATSKINPCIFKDYPSGSKYAWIDSLTGAQTTGASKLIAVAEMATWLDDKITAYGEECLQKPMAEAIKRMLRFLGELLPALQSAGWLVPTAELGGAAYQAQVMPNANSPYDHMDVRYDISYEGTNRVTTVQQTIVRKS